jgi:UDP-glucose 4-epimerase
MKKRILVTGGAGYIGSVAVKRLLDLGNSVIVVDNLSKGKKEIIDSRANFYQVDLVEKERLKKVFSENKIDSIIHFAAYKAVEESMSNGIKYSDNLIGTINLLNLAVKYKIKNLYFPPVQKCMGKVKLS